jgi:signal transduction histidine kinase
VDQEGATAPVSISALLEDVVAYYRSRVTHASTSMPAVIQLTPVSPTLLIHSDPEKLRQICYNILDNALKFSPNGGTVSVTAEAEGPDVHLAFKDEGIGIPPDRLARIFETFYQIDGTSTRRFGGLGLGLAAVAHIVEQLHGRVQVDTELDQGSTFHVWLPVNPSKQREPE